MIIISCLQIPLSFILFSRMPAISINDFIEIENSKEHSVKTNKDFELFSNLKVLFSNIVVVLIMSNTMVCVTNWGCYYGSFGIWLQQLFNLNAERLGLYVTICEAMAECISLCAIPILSRFIANSFLCIIGGICETLSVILLNVLLWNDGYVMNTYIMTLD